MGYCVEIDEGKIIIESILERDCNVTKCGKNQGSEYFS
jgi:hypothetical protein